jgi:NlpC/P60 family
MSLRKLIGGAWVLLLCGSCLLWAQGQSPKPARVPSGATSTKAGAATRLLDANDGLTILGAALEGRYKMESRSDCSHLVHAIYEKAGFPYKYQPSSDLYAGIDEFQRVSQPQPGDLIVWPGHAGIVVNPAQHTFFSALRSGFGMQPYDSGYWRRRGRPHFLRYVKATSQTVLAANRMATLQPAGLRSSENENPSAENLPEISPDELDAEPEQVSTAPEYPAAILVHAAHPKPEQLTVALWQQFHAAGDTLQSRHALAPPPALVAFDRFEVQKVQLKGERGHVQIRMVNTVAVSGSAAHSKKAREIQTWNLYRVSAEDWEIALPTNAVYLPRESAVRLLAHQLSALTDTSSSEPANSDQKVQLARWLNLLLESH